MGVTRRCNFLAKPRLRPLRPQDQASVHVTCTMSRLQRIARDPREPPAQCAGAYLRWTDGAARSASPTASCRRGRRSRSAKQSKRNPLIDAAMPYIAHKNFATKNRRERELEPQLTLGAPRSQTRQRGCDHANQDRPWPLSKCKALLALLSLDGHSHGGKRKVNLNRATTQAKREHKNKFENLCAILEMVNSKS